LKSQTRWSPTEPLHGMTPWQAALRLAHLPDLLFLDSARPAPGTHSIIAASPASIIEGDTADDWARLSGALAARSGQPGIAAGYVEYDGHFRFGIYEKVLRYSHDSASWSDPAGLAASMSGPPELPPEAIPFHPTMPCAEYESLVRRAQEYIAAGDIFQVNLAHRFTAPWSGHETGALGFYARLREHSPAPYAALLCTPQRIIASSSPELFLEINGRTITTRPIKGTRARGTDPGADTAAARDLAGSAKERAELIMITDLERNDLGRVCDYGTISVTDLLKLERHAQVHHMVSTVTGRLRENVTHIEALRACFPGGSITGAPKKRAREIIAELEPIPRGLYTGAIGYIDFNGHTQFNIAIRTAILERHARLAHFHAGAGIVADSSPAAEWQETLWKAAGLLRAGTTP
jgi:para-aminobenzoate synthetase component 1